LFVNVVGSCAIGALAGLTAPDGRPFVTGDIRAFLIIGVLGGFTTFSSFSLDTLSLARQGAWLAAGTNVLASVALCLLAVYLGFLAVVTLQR
jgi:CrcB protein